jgi:hypothetical protein
MTAIVVIVGIIVALLLFAATRPNSYRVERAATIPAPAGQVFGLLNDFHRWDAWSPWEHLDPAMKRTHSGAASGVGAVYEWDGNKKAGMGRMEITGSAPHSRITIKLDFLKPFESHNTTVFVLAAEGSATRVTWTMEGPSNFMTKLMGIFVSMDKMIGKDFEAGLANLTRVAAQSAGQGRA